jgi:hypothetical protein
VNVWKVILASLLIFGAGFVTGQLTPQIRERPQRPADATLMSHAPRQRLDYLSRLTRELDLSPSQKQKIEEILKESQEHTRRIWDSVAPQAREEYHQAREQIRAQLSPSQQARFDVVFKPKGRRHPGGGKIAQESNAPPGSRLFRINELSNSLPAKLER